jgi:hypothetical protein
MERVAIVVRLKEGSGPRAAELIAAGPPFDLAATGIAHHSVYLSAGEVVFVFEGHQVEWMVDDLINDPFQPKLQNTFRRLAVDRRRSAADRSRTVRLGSTSRRGARIPRRWRGVRHECARCRSRPLGRGRRRARAETVTLVYAARDAEHNDAVVPAEILRRGRRS